MIDLRPVASHDLETTQYIKVSHLCRGCQWRVVPVVARMHSRSLLLRLPFSTDFHVEPPAATGYG